MDIVIVDDEPKMCIRDRVRGRLSRVQGILLPVLYFAFCGIQFTL